jgi:hypothetical protein
MLKESMIAAAAAVSALVALLAMPESSKTEPALPDNGERDAYSVSDYYRGEYDWPRLKLAEPSTSKASLVTSSRRLRASRLTNWRASRSRKIFAQVLSRSSASGFRPAS